MNWVGSADGTTAWLFADTRLYSVYGEHTFFLYSIIYQPDEPVFLAAILRASDTSWTFVETKLKYFASSNIYPLWYCIQCDKIPVRMDVHLRCTVMLDDSGGAGGSHRPGVTWWKTR